MNPKNKLMNSNRKRKFYRIEKVVEYVLITGVVMTALYWFLK